MSRIKRKMQSLFLLNKDFSVISNNCWGGFLYQYYNLKYLTPFVGLFIFAPDYIKLLRNLDYCLAQPLVFIAAEDSKYKDELIKNGSYNTYPIGLLNDVEIHFLHYKTKEDACEKWNRRLQRLNRNNLIVKFCDRDFATEDLIREFDELAYAHKICFTSKPYPELASVVFLKQCNTGETVYNEWIFSKKQLNMTRYLNGMIRRK